MHSYILRVLLILIYVSSVYSKDDSGKTVMCGPEERCSCKGQTEMDCSNSDAQLKDVCFYIHNTHRNMSVLHMDSLNNGIAELRQYDLQGCQELVELYLSNNSMTKIDNGVFYNFKHLEILDISKNNLNVYYASTRERIIFPASLKVLNLMGNYNMSIHDNLSYPDLSEVSELQTLFIDGLPFTDFSTSYRSLHNLSNVTMSGLYGNCNISSVTNETFIHLPRVRYLNISACNITDIDAFGFGSLTNLENLDLSLNMRLGFRAVKNITYGLQYTNIRVLNISKIHTTFGPSTRIMLEDVCYLRNTSLREIDVSRNRIEFFENNVLAIVPKTLSIVRMEYNKFTFRPYLLQLGCLANVTEGYGSFQNFAYDPRLFDHEYQGMDDREYDKADDSCPFFKEASVRNNLMCPFFKPGEKIEITNIKYLPKLPQKLQKVEFSQSGLIYHLGNLIMIKPSDKLEYIDLSGNVFYSWEGPIRPLNSLKHLDMSKNYCSHVKRYFFQFAQKSLENLQVQNNFLGTVLKDEQNGPFIFNNLKELKTLNLSYNIISDIPQNLLLGSHKIETLDLSVNNIEKWTLDVSRLDSLLYLVLRSNFLQTLPEELRSRLKENSKRKGKPFKIDLRNNTFEVNCGSKDFLEWLVNHENNMIGFDKYIFVDSSGHRMTSDEFKREVSHFGKTCLSYTLIIVLSAMGISVFLSIVLGGVVYKNRWYLRYLLRNTKVRHFGYQAIRENKDTEYRYDFFVSYATQNSDFIRNKLYPYLEQKGFRVCLHEKHFLPGNNIADNILDAISNSRKTLVVLSSDYVASEWCMYEFNMARMESIYERGGSPCFFIVLFEQVPSRNMSNEMLQWLSRNTYLEYTTDEQGELSFWQKLDTTVGNEMYQF